METFMTVRQTAQQPDFYQQRKENFVTRKDKYLSLARDRVDL